MFNVRKSDKKLFFFSLFLFIFSFIDRQNQMRFCRLLPIHYYYLCNIATRIILMVMDPL